MWWGKASIRSYSHTLRGWLRRWYLLFTKIQRKAVPAQESGITCQAFLLRLLSFRFPPGPPDFLLEEDSESTVLSYVNLPHSLWSKLCSNRETRNQPSLWTESTKDSTNEGFFLVYSLREAGLRILPGGLARQPLKLNFHGCHIGSFLKSGWNMSLPMKSGRSHQSQYWQATINFHLKGHHYLTSSALRLLCVCWLIPALPMSLYVGINQIFSLMLSVYAAFIH